nr:DNA primase [Chloroflexia bacterium]
MVNRSRTIIDEVKDRLDIVDIVGSSVELRRSGRNYTGLCPFHQEKTPSFIVNPERGSYKCFGCGKGGDVVSFLMESEKLDFKDALKQLAERAGVQYEEPKPPAPEEESAHRRLLEVNKLAARYYNHLLLTSADGASARAYLEGRGIERAAWETWTLGYAPNSWDATLKFLQGRN